MPDLLSQISTSEEYIGTILNDLAQRRSQIHRIESPPSGGGGGRGQRHLTARTPLSQLLGYSHHLRTSTSGMAHCSMTPDSYEVVAADELERVRNQIYGRWRLSGTDYRPPLVDANRHPYLLPATTPIYLLDETYVVTYPVTSQHNFVAYFLVNDSTEYTYLLTL